MTPRSDHDTRFWTVFTFIIASIPASYPIKFLTREHYYVVLSNDKNYNEQVETRRVDLMSWRERGICIHDEEREETVEVNPPAMVENVKMPLLVDPVDDPLGVLSGYITLSLDLGKEPPEVIRIHNAILRVPLEDRPDLGGRLRGR